MSSKLVGLVDADFIKYLVVYDVERMYKKGLDPNTEIPYSTIISMIEARLEQIYRATQKHTKEYLFLFSGKTKDNYRSLMAAVKPYKGNRKYDEKVPKEGEYRNTVEDYIQANYNYFKYPELEADDLCVMGHCPGTYIYSNDKDLRVSPGIHFDIKNNKFFRVTKDDGFRTLLIQAMTGDSVDNIAGLEGVGPVGAKKIAGKLTGKALLLKVMEEYISKHGVKPGLDRFVEMYSLVNLKTNRGAWTQSNYKDFFDKVKELLKAPEEAPTFF